MRQTTTQGLGAEEKRHGGPATNLARDLVVVDEDERWWQQLEDGAGTGRDGPLNLDKSR